MFKFNNCGKLILTANNKGWDLKLIRATMDTDNEILIFQRSVLFVSKIVIRVVALYCKCVLSNLNESDLRFFFEDFRNVYSNSKISMIIWIKRFISLLKRKIGYFRSFGTGNGKFKLTHGYD